MLQHAPDSYPNDSLCSRQELLQIVDPPLLDLCFKLSPGGGRAVLIQCAQRSQGFEYLRRLCPDVKHLQRQKVHVDGVGTRLHLLAQSLAGSHTLRTFRASPGTVDPTGTDIYFALAKL